MSQVSAVSFDLAVKSTRKLSPIISIMNSKPMIYFFISYIVTLVSARATMEDVFLIHESFDYDDKLNVQLENWIGVKAYSGYTAPYPKGATVVNPDGVGRGYRSQKSTIIQDSLYDNINGILEVSFYDDMNSDKNKANGMAAVCQDDDVNIGLMENSLMIGLMAQATNQTAQYSFRVGSGAYVNFGNRSSGWHKLRFDTSSGTQLVVYLDNALVTTTTQVHYIKALRLGAFGWGTQASDYGVTFDNVLLKRSKVLPTSSRLRGFNYWPQYLSCDVLYADNWTSANKTQVKKDLDQICALGGNIVRLFFWSDKSGYLLSTNGGGRRYSSHYSELCANLPELLQFCHLRNISVIVVFANDYLSTWWKQAYGDTGSGYQHFCSDSIDWINGIISACEGSPDASAITYYDMQNESRVDPDHGWQYLQTIYDNGNWPAGKKGISIRWNYDIPKMKNALGDNRIFNFFDHHAYPYPGYTDGMFTYYGKIRVYYPDAKVVLGEFGRNSSDDSFESEQCDSIATVSNFISTRGYEFFIHWMPWDKTPGSDPSQVAGLSYDYDTAKNALAAVSSSSSILSNVDMELGPAGARPDNWYATGTNPCSLLRNAADTPSTNSSYARLSTSGYSSGAYYIRTNSLPIEPGVTRTLFCNAYVRSNMDNIRILIRQYDSAGGHVDSYGPQFTPKTWRWVNYINSAGDFFVTLNSNTTRVQFFVGGDDNSDSVNYLDVDTVSCYIK